MNKSIIYKIASRVRNQEAIKLATSLNNYEEHLKERIPHVIDDLFILWYDPSFAIISEETCIDELHKVEYAIYPVDFNNRIYKETIVDEVIKNMNLYDTDAFYNMIITTDKSFEMFYGDIDVMRSPCDTFINRFLDDIIECFKSEDEEDYKYLIYKICEE